MGLFSRGMDIESGIEFADGWFRTGARPPAGHARSEVYSLTCKDDPPELWFLVTQERLSRAPRWRDDYFQILAETLAFGHAGEALMEEMWVAVVFDALGKLQTRVHYWPIFADGGLDDIAYKDATALLAASDALARIRRMEPAAA
jgi:hypothetical protein